MLCCAAQVVFVLLPGLPSAGCGTWHSVLGDEMSTEVMKTAEGWGCIAFQCIALHWVKVRVALQSVALQSVALLCTG